MNYENLIRQIENSDVFKRQLDQVCKAALREVVEGNADKDTLEDSKPRGPSRLNLEPAGNFFHNEGLAEFLGVSTATLARWRRLRTGPSWTKAGHRVLYSRADVEAWMAANAVLPESE